MSVRKLRIDRFRCLTAVEIEADRAQNVVIGPNGAGKTSILEAVFFLGRGRTFRQGTSAALIQSGAEAFTIFGELREGGVTRRAGVRGGRDGLSCQVDGAAGSTADLIAALPVQVIDPQVHELVQGGPKGRREFVDWGVFHVKHDFYPLWRRYRRALQQRNRALRQGQGRMAVASWDQELLAAGGEIDRLRAAYLETFRPDFEATSRELLGFCGTCHYRSGWPREMTLAEALEASWDRDRRYGQTHVGPHRAELTLEVDEVVARNRLSRGQQKLLGISLVLAQSEFVARQLDRDVVLLVDEPAAELDGERLEKLMEALSATRAQLFISALEREALPLRSGARVFHVERGEVTILL